MRNTLIDPALLHRQRLPWAVALGLGLACATPSVFAAMVTSAAVDSSALLAHPAHRMAALWALTATVVIAWLAHARRQALVHWASRADGAQRAVALGAALLLVDLALAGAFWLTRDKTVDEVGGLKALFFVGGEGNVPAIYSGLQFWLAGWLAAQCAGRSHPAGALSPGMARVVWSLAAAVCVYLGADELFMLHERITQAAVAHGWMNSASHSLIQLGGWQVRPWTLIFVPAAGVVGLSLAVMFFRMLPAGSGLFPLLVAAGAVFITGAAGFENLQAHQLATGAFERQETGYYLNLLIEEGLEMVGVSMAVFVFARCAFDRAGPVTGRGSPKAR